jgi:hypothetical protein
MKKVSKIVFFNLTKMDLAVWGGFFDEEKKFKKIFKDAGDYCTMYQVPRKRVDFLVASIYERGERLEARDETFLYQVQSTKYQEKGWNF